MSTFKIAFAMVLAACMGVAVAQGPGQGGPGGRPGQGGPGMGGPGGRGGFRMDPAQMVKFQLEMFKKELKLTPKQEPKVKAILEESTKAMQKLREEKGDRESKRPKMEKLRAESNAKLAKVLTKEQVAKLEELRKKMRGMGRGPGGPGGPGAGPAGGPGGMGGMRMGGGKKP